MFAEKAFKHCIPAKPGRASAQILVSKYFPTKRNQFLREKATSRAGQRKYKMSLKYLWGRRRNH